LKEYWEYEKIYWEELYIENKTIYINIQMKIPKSLVKGVRGMKKNFTLIIIISVLFLAVGLVLFSDYILLNTVKVDGDRTGLLFSDGLLRVTFNLIGADELIPEWQVATYANLSLIVSLLFFATALYVPFCILYTTLQTYKQW